MAFVYVCRFFFPAQHVPSQAVNGNSLTSLHQKVGAQMVKDAIKDMSHLSCPWTWGFKLVPNPSIRFRLLGHFLHQMKCHLNPLKLILLYV